MQAGPETRAAAVPAAVFALAAGAALAVDARAVGCGCLGEVAYHARAAWTWAALLLVACAFVALAAWSRLPPALAAAALAAGGGVSNAAAAALWGGAPDYWRPAGLPIVLNAGDLAVWVGDLAAVAALLGAAALHLRRGGSLRDEARTALRRD